MHFPYVYKWKAGITGYLWIRRKQTSSKVFGFYIVLGAVRMPFAFQVEQFFLSATKKFRRQIHGKGGVEIRAWYVCIPLLVFIYAAILIKWSLPFWSALFVSWFAVKIL